MAQDFAINIDFAVMREDGSKRRTLLAWGDPVRMTKRTASRIDVLVFTDSGRRDFHEVYADDVDAQGEVTPRVKVMAS
jgi:hypothetical protein